ncbi:MAG: NAD(P)-dependent alcohol dehydrogenase [Anaerolineae bacterium]|jgi:NADPH:quinone reductase-like Zn-dependent oxidoreductase|nr:NAD(P)-dependent alcohol dehydrogenase [Anaerolineae bacterium]MBT7075867.1 NAD(P)-dependent alcohol dehydrogenase [Anaerolineae bacterium]MBT7781604.1 NAD(P)-dependent alcohol dehydrogenase [Anaerolineae bacterium]
MKAILTKEYGNADVLVVADIEKPIIEEGELLIQVMATSVNPMDWKIRDGEMKMMTGKTPPQVLGADFAGIVSKVNPSVKGFKKGDEVYGMVNGMKGGAYAEYLKIKEDMLAMKPSNISFEEAASLPMVAQTAYQALVHKAQVKKGDHVLINGATGGVGSAAVQIAKALGCMVTGVCSTKNIEFSKSLGADHIVDYKKENVLTNQNSYDIVFDTIGNHSFAEFKPTLKPGGTFVTTAPTIPAMLFGSILNLFRSKKSEIVMSASKTEDLNAIRKMVQEGKLKPQIAKVFTMDQIKDAHILSEKGRVVGKIVIKI